ncbi:MAG TPA: diguanylate cyclase [Burkholderiales bacterium]|nr:diguanylate cyclase [Burkholderiales bacterium]
MELLERIEEQMESTRLPLFAITLAAVPCPDTPVILTLHWHGFLRDTLVDVEGAQPVSYRSVPSSALQLNSRWEDVLTVDRAALDAAWELGAWDVARAERPSCTRPGADSAEALDCLKAFGAFPFGAQTDQVLVADAPDADELVSVAARRGYLMWLFRPVHGGIWKEFADDATLLPDGTREPPCPIAPVPPRGDRAHRTVYRFGVSERLLS